MEVKYTLDIEDHWNYHRFVLNRITKLKFRRIFNYCFVPLMVAVEFLLFGFNRFLVVGLFLVFLLIWNLFLSWFSKYVYMKAVRRRPGQLGLHTLTITSDYLKETSTVGESKLPWSSIIEITESPSLLCFFIDPRFAVIVPKSAFSGDGARVFLELAQGYHGHAVYGKPLPAEPQEGAWPPAPRSGV